MADYREIGDDDLVTLTEACDLFFGGRLTKSSLRLEASRGNLPIIRIANKDFVTRRGVKEMIEKCTIVERVPQSQQPPSPRGTASQALKKMLNDRKANG